MVSAPDRLSSGVADLARRIAAAVETAVVGKPEPVRHAIVTLLAGGHLLIEDIPGVGKTTLAKALARAIGGEFRRIQFTPDLLPADVTGTSVFNQRDSDFEFRPGPVFANVMLADEINRATPKTQSSLLEAMEEGQVSTDGVTRPLPRPFFVIATQNSVEMTGTYPLPEAQLDRFFARISLGYPGRDAERLMLESQRAASPLAEIAAVVTLDEVLAAQREVRDVRVDDRINDYVLDIVRATRDETRFVLGASPRAALHLIRAAQARAAMEGRTFVRPDDVKGSAVAILSHRATPRGGMGAETAMAALLEGVPAPVPA